MEQGALERNYKGQNQGSGQGEKGVGVKRGEKCTRHNHEQDEEP